MPSTMMTAKDVALLHILKDNTWLVEELADMKNNLATMAQAVVDEFIQKEALKTALSETQEELRQTVEKVSEQEHEIFEWRKVVFNAAEHLTARERHRGAGTMGEQLVETQHFIAQLGGRLMDLVSGKEQRESRWDRLNAP
ncbi:hypothetical protein K438DRAFT_1979519 [Mycena galopus ATCC 62051]|nr:hypothetical protein K438DRAFT_1979519 [Mycena galopus ATCC 62051]